MNTAQAKALRTVSRIVIEAVDVAGTAGASGGILYAGMMTAGVSFEQFTQIMAGLVRAGMLVKSGELYRATDKGRAFAGLTVAA